MCVNCQGGINRVFAMPQKDKQQKKNKLDIIKERYHKTETPNHSRTFEIYLTDLCPQHVKNYQNTKRKRPKGLL